MSPDHFDVLFNLAQLYNWSNHETECVISRQKNDAEIKLNFNKIYSEITDGHSDRGPKIC